MEDLGLDDGDDAVQYALMLSMEEQGSQPAAALSSQDDGEHSDIDDDEAQALRAVESFEKSEDEEMQEVIRMIRRAEEIG